MLPKTVDPAHRFLVFYEGVDLASISRNHKISIQNRVAGHNLIKAAVKLLNAVLQELVEPLSILSTHETILEYSTAFVIPQLQ